VNLARHIEHTLLKADATPHAVETLCQEVLAHGLLGACVNPVHVPLAKSILADSLRAGTTELVTVIGFPLGAGSERSDCSEVQWAIEQGATEVDWVVPVGLARAGQLAEVTRRASCVRRAAKGVVLKVILETGFFSSDELHALALAVLESGPDFLKTSTGFGPRGASVEDVTLLTKVGQGRARVKASGGIRDRAQAEALVRAGAERLGTSNGVALVTSVIDQAKTSAY
jgi:deoxyribose-phosphate aldolase